jgi:hypothetical protein
MDHLPKDIADLCGVMLNSVKATSAPEVRRYDNPIQLKEEGDGTFTLTYFDKVVGWINKTKLDKRDGNAYRAVSVHGDVHLCFSERSAQDWLMSRYH